jgi:hypothetical protein
MRLNIVSRSVGRKRVFGAGKVLQNTLKGLANIGVEVRLNEPIADHQYNWIHDAPEGIIEAGFAGRPVLVGPNTATTPADLPRFRRQLNPSSIYLFPSDWPMKAWKAMGFDECRCRVWAAGIDLDCFPVRRRWRSDDDRVLIYFKHRADELLSKTEALVRECGWRYEIFRYGSYDETGYKAALARAKCGIWVGGTESQGFALMEALASGLPLLVLDAPSLADNVHEPCDPLVPRFPARFVASGAAAAPYFDPRCGLRIAAPELDRAVLERFFCDVERFAPASFVREGFSLEQSARRLTDLAEELPGMAARPATIGSTAAKLLRYFDLASRPWPWKLAGRRLLQRIR